MRKEWINWVAAILTLAIVAGWGGMAISRRAAGAGATDPYTYVQMGIDLATTGSLLHKAPLIEEISKDQADSYAFVNGLLPTGYSPTIPLSSHGRSIFPPGISLVLAAAHRLGGESALFLIPPLVGIFILLLTMCLAHALLRAPLTPFGWIAGVVAVALPVVSELHSGLGLVPRSDPPSELFILAAACLCLSLRPSARLRWVFLTGLLIGVAYLMRHPSLLFLLPCLGWTLAQRGWTVRGWTAVAVLLTGFASVSLPELAYHNRVYGGFLVAENPLSLTLAWHGLAENTILMVQRLGSSDEFGILLALVPVGLWRLHHRGLRLQAWFVAAWVGSYILFHVPLELTALYDNPTRFLLPVFPALGCLIGYAVAGMRWNGSLVRRVGSGMVLLVVLASVYQKSRYVPAGFDYTLQSYGHLTAGERSTYESFDNLLPASAVVVSDDWQSGAIQLYSKRPTVRASLLTPQQFDRFVTEARIRGWPIYAVSRRLPEYVRSYPLTRVKGVRGRLLLLE